MGDAVLTRLLFIWILEVGVVASLVLVGVLMWE